jgi:hypothetical protein
VTVSVCGSVWPRAAVRPCAAVGVAGHAAMCSGAAVRQCAAVCGDSVAVCGIVGSTTVQQCAGVRQCSSAAVRGSVVVWHYAAVPQQWVALRAAVCGSVRGSVCMFVFNNDVRLNLS